MGRKYHLGKNGPAVCRARIKCRLGGESGLEDHFESLEEARAAFEKGNKSVPGVFRKASPGGSFSSGVPLSEVSGFHSAGSCAGDVCPVHRPSEHPFDHCEQRFDGDYMLRVVTRNGVVGSDGRMIVVDPDDYVLYSTGSAILSNRVECPECGDVVESRSRHDFASCGCGETFTDGGRSYLRRTANAIDRSTVFFVEDGVYGYRESGVEHRVFELGQRNFLSS